MERHTRAKIQDPSLAVKTKTFKLLVLRSLIRLDADHNGDAIFEYCPHSESQTVPWWNEM